MSKKRIFISPLDWGLGHATRIIPIIEELQNNNVEVIIGAERDSLNLLTKEFPKVPYLEFPGYRVSYSENNFNWNMIKQAPNIVRTIKKEQHFLTQLIDKYHFNGVISDNRYGLYTKSIPSVFITHQLFIKTPVFSSWVNKLNHRYIKRFSLCWVPDYEGDENLSGALSHGESKLKNIQFIGPLSRFGKLRVLNLKHNIVAVLSGPEPQRTILEQELLSELKKLEEKVLVVQGMPSKKEITTIKNISLVPHLNAAELEKEMSNARVIIARSGYSTIMDLEALGKKAILIPTPAQTEQEYLAKYHSDKGHCVIQKQSEINIKKGLEKAKTIAGFKPVQNQVLSKRVKEFLELV